MKTIKFYNQTFRVIDDNANDDKGLHHIFITAVDTEYPQHVLQVRFMHFKSTGRNEIEFDRVYVPYDFETKLKEVEEIA